MSHFRLWELDLKPRRSKIGRVNLRIRRVAIHIFTDREWKQYWPQLCWFDGEWDNFALGSLILIRW